MRPATAQDLKTIYEMATVAAQRAQDHHVGYIVASQNKDAEFGFRFVATDRLKQCHASMSGGVVTAAENMLYALACESPVTIDFDPWDIDEYRDNLHGGTR